MKQKVFHLFRQMTSSSICQFLSRAFLLAKRSDQKELIDLGFEHYTLEEYKACLEQLGKVGHLLGGNAATLSKFSQLKERPNSILDVGCGGGFFARLLAKKYPEAKVLGIDFSKEAIAYALESVQFEKNNHLSFEVPETLELNFPPQTFDVVTATLVCHHMQDEELIEFLKRAKKVARNKIIINDLHRNFFAYCSFALIAPLLFRNRLITHDGLISIKRGFTKQEWVNYLEKAGFDSNQYEITWKWAFRWMITITV